MAVHHRAERTHELTYAFPFSGADGASDILAYWYNVPPASFTERQSGKTVEFYSTLEVYGRTPQGPFEVETAACAAGGSVFLVRTFSVQDGGQPEGCSLELFQGYFKLVCRVDYLPEPPQTISVAIRSAGSSRHRELSCLYHRLFGRVTDFQGNPFPAVVRVEADGFGRDSTSVRTDSAGNYEILLPERSYNSLWVDDESYGIDTLEAWAWHIVMDADQRLDFRVGTAEVYNLHAWANNGGYAGYFLAFRPMVLTKHGASYDITLNETPRRVTDIAPELGIGDIRVSVNGCAAEILSVQKFYETGPTWAMPSYLVQISKSKTDPLGKRTFLLEYRKEMEIGGVKMLREAMGYCQGRLNFNGYSEYY